MLWSRRWIGSWAVCAIVMGAVSARAQEIASVRVDSGLDQPTYVTHAPADFVRLFITELGGDIEILDLETGVRNASPFLSVVGSSGEGLQGLAFHPLYALNGFFYVYFFGSGQSNVVRYSRLTSDSADPGSALPILQIPQPFGDHNGGWIGFGPDGLLYVPVGDGGTQHDPSNNGQNIVGELLGNVLRIDVDADDFPGDPNRNYAIPSDNPFVGITGEDEIWAYGLRNPFRASFDRLTGDFYIADVGQHTREEIDFQSASSIGGENYGWRLREGSIATPTGGIGGPQPPDGVDPLYEYDHGSGSDQGASVTGGYVYRGPIPQLSGRYFFGDYENERIWSIRHDGSQVTEFRDWTGALQPPGQSIDQIVGFGEDAAGNLYIVDLGGEIFRVTGPSVPALPGALPLAGLALGLATAAVLRIRRGSALPGSSSAR